MEFNPTPPGPNVRLNGQPVATRRFFEPRPDFGYRRNPVDFARFEHDPAAAVTVEFPGADSPPALIPEQGAHLLDAAPGHLAFRLPEPGHFAIRAPGHAWLFLRADPPALTAAPPNARTITEFGVTPGSAALQCAAINAAIRRVASEGGGTLRFPAGIYRIATVEMRSRVTLHLEDGAHLRATSRVAAYPQDPDGVLFTDLPPSLVPGARRRVILWEGCEDAAITGRGTIDGRGSEIRLITCHTPGGRPLINLMRFVHCRRCRVEGVTLLDSEFWSSHVLLSDGIVFDSVQVLNERPPRGWAAYFLPGNTWTWNNTDGINPDSSRSITVRHCLLHTGDDCVAVKNTGTHRNELRDVRDIRVHDNLMIGQTAMKIGTETRGGSIRGVRFERNRIAQCSRAFAAELKDGAAVGDIAWTDTIVDECNRPFDLEILPRQDHPDQRAFSTLDGALVRNLEVRRYRSEGQHWQCHLRGLDATHTLRSVRLENLRFQGTQVSALDPPVFVLGNGAEEVSLDGIPRHRRNANPEPAGRHSARTLAMSLVEILVAVAIAAALAALLLPAAGRVLERSRVTSSLSNLRQIGAALASYAGDHDGYLPGGRTPATAPSPNQNLFRTGHTHAHWTEEVTPYLDPNNQEPTLGDVSSTFRDPVYVAIAGPIANPSENYRGGYSWNGRMGLAHGLAAGEWAPTSSRMTRTKRVAYPNDTIAVGPYFWEAFHPANDGTVPDGRFSVTKTQSVNHGRRIGAGTAGTGGRSALYLFVDGTVLELTPGTPNSTDPSTAANYLKLRSP